MCRLFAMSGGPETIGATFWLLDAKVSLVRQARANADGTGMAWFDEDGLAYVDKLPIAGHVDAAFAADARRVRARTILAHVRYATSTPRTIDNTHPFLQEGRVFGHNGVVGDLDKIDARLGEHGYLLRGEADSERLFALITREIALAGGDVRAGIVSAVRWLAEEIELYSLNFVMASASEVWAFRYPAHNTLFMLKRRSTDPAPMGHPFASTDKPTPGLGVAAPDTAHQSAVIFASEQLNDDAWQPVEPGELVHVHPDLTITRETIIDFEPLVPMVLGRTEAAAQGIVPKKRKKGQPPTPVAPTSAADRAVAGKPAV